LSFLKGQKSANLSFCKGQIDTEISVSPVAAKQIRHRSGRLARESDANVKRKPEEIYDTSFVNNLEKSGFLKEIWGSENYRRYRRDFIVQYRLE
jgi:hypothetical protein